MTTEVSEIGCRICVQEAESVEAPALAMTAAQMDENSLLVPGECSRGSAEMIAGAAMAGALCKAGDHTMVLNERYFVLTGTKLRYWLTEALCRAGKPARDEVTVLSAEEWPPPTSSSSRRRLMKLQSKLQSLPILTSHEAEADGRHFVVFVSRGSKGEATFQLRAGDRTERIAWLSAIAARVQCMGPGWCEPFDACKASHCSRVPTGSQQHALVIPPPTRPPPAPTEASSSVASPWRHNWRILPANHDGAANSDVLLAEAIAALPRIWRLWYRAADDARAVAEAHAQYATLLRRVPGCWQALQDRARLHLATGELRRAESDCSSALVMPSAWSSPGSHMLWVECSGSHRAQSGHASCAQRPHRAVHCVWYMHAGGARGGPLPVSTACERHERHRGGLRSRIGLRCRTADPWRRPPRQRGAHDGKSGLQRGQ